MQAFLSKYGVYVAAMAIVLAGVIYYLSANRGPGIGAAPRSAFFVDEETAAESVRPISDVPPLPGASGKDTLVGEYKYSVDGGKTAKVGYYYKYMPDMKKKMEATPAGQAPAFDPAQGELVRSPERGSRWVRFDSDEGQALVGVHAPAGQTLLVVNP